MGLLSWVNFLFFLSISTATADSHLNRKLVFAVDGFSYEAFQAAKAKGLFPSFSQSARHIAPYPSMSEVAWPELLGIRTLFPIQGNARTIESKYYDLDTNIVEDDIRTLFNRFGNPYNFMRAFDYYFNPFLESLMYVSEDAAISMELEEIEKDIPLNFTGNHYIAYLASSDVTAHTKKGQLYPYLERLSAIVERVIARYRNEQGFEAWMISDHGNEGLFKEGEEETTLKSVTLKPVARALGLQIVEKGKLVSSDQIAVPVLGLVSNFNVYFYDLGKRDLFARALIEQMPEVEVVTYADYSNAQKSVVVLGSELTSGAPKMMEARLYYEKEKNGSFRYAYLPVTGNPLLMPSKFFSTSTSSLKWLMDEDVFRETSLSHFPDAAFRLVQSAAKQVENSPDLIVSLRRGHVTKGGLGSYVEMVRTHGALSDGASFGLVATTKPDEVLPPAIRSEDVFTWIRLSTGQVFHRLENLSLKPLQVLDKIKAGIKQGISTQFTDFSIEMVYLRLHKVLWSTLDVLTPDDLQDVKLVLEGYLSVTNEDHARMEAKNVELNDELKKLDLKKTMLSLDRLIIGLRQLGTPQSSSEKLYNDLESLFLTTPGLEPLADVKKILNRGDSKVPQDVVEAAHRIAAKLLATPQMVNEWLSLPEQDYLKETRDVAFAENWMKKVSHVVKYNPFHLIDDVQLTEDLFKQIFTERKLVHKISPATTPLLYNPSMKELTVVFVPGIYNEVFGREVFAKALRSLRENFGLRVLYADVDSRCSVNSSAQMIMKTMKEDRERRLQRGYSEPRYLVMGYSKGAVDAVESLLIDENFTRQHVLGLVSIAGAQKGTKFSGTGRLPDSLAGVLTTKPLPHDCAPDLKSESLSSAVRSNFWKNNIQKLIGLTRFYSTSFYSEVEDAHPLMKIAKNVVRYNVPNDGFVSVENSKFPEELFPTHLGSFYADHFAGALTSKFEQTPFLESIILFLFETHALEKQNLLAWYDDLSQRHSRSAFSYYERYLGQRVLIAQLQANTPLTEMQGPLPDAYDKGDALTEWIEVIVKQSAYLDQKLVAAPQAKVAEFLKKFETLLDNTPYKLKPVELKFDSAVKKYQLRINTTAYSAWRFWASNVWVESYPVTVRDLVDELLQHAMESGVDYAQKVKEVADVLPKSERIPFVLPSGSVWDENYVISIYEVESYMASLKVPPMLPASYPNGISMIFDHQSVRDFRREYRVSFENATEGDAEDNRKKGISAVLDPSGEVVARFQTQNTSIKMTTTAFRFKASDFPKFKMKFKVLKNVDGANPAKGGSGKEDAAMQVWFSLRELKDVKDRSLPAENSVYFMLGYYYSEDNEVGPALPEGSVIENWYSMKSYGFKQLPNEWQISLGGGKQNVGKWMDVSRNLVDDIKRVYPKVDPNDVEILGITLQSDSDATKSEAEAYFKSMSFSQ